jgi:hypothetical protein
MDLPVAFPTHGDEVFLGIIAQFAARHDVMNFQSLS